MASFNIYDFYNIDGEVEKFMFQELGANDWSLLIGHMLGIDHIGHIHLPASTQMDEKLVKTAITINALINHLDNDSVLFIFGDHGMSDKGFHGGSSQQEVETGLLSVYGGDWNFRGISLGNTNVNGYHLNQIDFAATFAEIFQVPFPHNNIGRVMTELIPFKKNCTKAMIFQLLGLPIFVNAFQIWNIKKNADIKTDLEIQWKRYLEILNFNEVDEKELIEIYSDLSKQLSQMDDALRLKNGAINTMVLLVGIVVQTCFIIILLRKSISFLDTVILITVSAMCVALQDPFVIMAMIPYHIFWLIKNSRPFKQFIIIAKENYMSIISSTIVVIAALICLFVLEPMRMEDLVVYGATLVLLALGTDRRYLPLFAIMLVLLPSMGRLGLNKGGGTGTSSFLTPILNHITVIMAVVNLTGVVLFKAYVYYRARSPLNKERWIPYLPFKIVNYVADAFGIAYMIEKVLSTNILHYAYAICMGFYLVVIIFCLVRRIYSYSLMFALASLVLYCSKVYLAFPMIVIVVFIELSANSKASWNSLLPYMLSLLLFYHGGHLKRISALQVECAYNVFITFNILTQGSIILLNIIGPALLVVSMWNHCNIVSKAEDKLKLKRKEYDEWLGIMIETFNLLSMCQLVLNRGDTLLTDIYAPKCLFDILLNKIFVVLF